VLEITGEFRWLDVEWPYLAFRLDVDAGAAAGGGVTFRCCGRKAGREVKIFVHLINSDPGNTEVTRLEFVYLSNTTIWW